MNCDHTELGRRIEERYQALRAVRAPWETVWTDIAKYVMPRRAPGLNGTVIVAKPLPTIGCVPPDVGY